MSDYQTLTIVANKCIDNPDLQKNVKATVVEYGDSVESTELFVEEIVALNHQTRD